VDLAKRLNSIETPEQFLQLLQGGPALSIAPSNADAIGPHNGTMYNATMLTGKCNSSQYRLYWRITSSRKKQSYEQINKIAVNFFYSIKM